MWVRPVTGAEQAERDGFVTADFAGTGFMLMKRSVFEQMMAGLPRNALSPPRTTGPTPNPSPNQYALFDCIIEKETGHYLSEDYTFCKRWRAIGGKVWLDTQQPADAHRPSRVRRRRRRAKFQNSGFKAANDGEV